MKILHVAMLPEKSVGIIAQMKQEQFAASELGIDWKSLVYTFAGVDDECPDLVIGEIRPSCGRFSKLKNYIRLRYAFFKYLLSIRTDYETILVRYNIMDPFLPLSLLFIRQKVFLVHHTKEVDELLSSSSKVSWFKALIEKILGAINLSLCQGVIGVTGEITDYEVNRNLTRKKIKTFTYPNGTLVNLRQKFTNEHIENQIPNILFIASHFYPWHGLDLLIAGLDSCKLNFKLHLVGTLADEDLVAIENDDRIVIYGTLSQHQIVELASRCCCSLGSFALDRKGLKQACTLKVREYLALGLPVIAGHEDVFSSEFPYFKKRSADLNEIINESYKFIAVDKNDVVRSSYNYIDKRLILKKLYDQLY